MYEDLIIAISFSKSIILLEQIRTIDKRRLDSYIGHLSQKIIDGVNKAILISLGFNDRDVSL